MKTDQLIALLAADPKRERPVAATLALVLAAGALGVSLVALPLLGVRPDLWTALGDGRVLVKHLLVIFMLLAAFGASIRVVRPGLTLGVWGLLMTVIAGFALLAALGAMMATPPEAWGAAMQGTTGWVCMPFIVGMSIPLLAASIWALRRGAPSYPWMGGAMAGLLSGSLAAAIYAMHCTEDSPIYYVVWYGIALAAVTFAGALLGNRWLRW
jgi:hypothetical protein